ncbi:MAG: hypothetical protein KA140_02680 [Caldisericia bacterium]|nr:hypothetical protein [Caldisericia bacterium]
MKKAIITVLVIVAIFGLIPAKALNKGLVYGFVLNPPGPFGPVKVQTYEHGILMAKIPPNMTTSSLYLGADVCCEVDSYGELYIADLPNDSRDYTDKRSWMAQIITWDPDNYNYWVTSPAGMVQLLVNSDFVNHFAVREGSYVRITAIKSAWFDRFTVIDMKVISW